MAKMPDGWLNAHDEIGARRANGHALMADHINPRIVAIWFQKRIALADDTVVRDHLRRSLRWLEQALTAEQEGKTSTEQEDGTLSATQPPRGGRVY